MTGSRKYVDAALRTSREIAACIGRIQNPRSNLSHRNLMNEKIHSIRYRLEDFSSDIVEDLSALTGTSEEQGVIEDARLRLLSQPLNQIEVWAVQHATRFRGSAKLAEPAVMMLNAADQWQAGAHAARGADRGVLQSLRSDANAAFIGVGLASLATSFSGTVADDLRLLARATLIVETDDGASP